MTHAAIRIGTAGWSIPKALGEDFVGAGSHLERYARRMNSAEINSSFHRPHKRQVYERWAAATSDDFRFAVKAPKLLTHDQRLSDPDAVLDIFAAQAAGLGDKLTVILVQLPPSLIFYPELANRFFEAVGQRFEASVVCEPRHASWFAPDADHLLVERRVARVAADPAKAPRGGQPGGWTGLSYTRLHGSPRIYYSAYAPDFIAEQARQLRALSAKAEAWCIFDNTASGAALADALALAGALDPA